MSAGIALASAPPQPARPVAPSLYSGRWYEVARIPNFYADGENKVIYAKRIAERARIDR